MNALDVKILPIENQRPKDWAAFAGIMYEYYPYPFENVMKNYQKEFEKNARKKNSFAVGAYYRSELIGFGCAIIQKASNAVVLKNLYIQKKFRATQLSQFNMSKLYLGSRILGVLESCAMADSEYMVLKCSGSSIGFYLKQGYDFYSADVHDIRGVGTESEKELLLVKPLSKTVLGPGRGERQG